MLITVCVRDRRPLLANAEMCDLLSEIWRGRASHWSAGRFVLMPDHLHVFASSAIAPGRPVEEWVSYWKRLVSSTVGFSLWQPNFWDRQLRTEEHYGQRWEYVRQNPVRAGLVASAEDWPWQGEINRLPW